MDYVLFGMQGSGKGTQSKHLAQAKNLAVFETGAELRKMATSDTDLGRKVKGIMESGNLVSTEVVMDIIRAFIDGLAEGQAALFDGIPRSKDQQEQFDALMESTERKFTGVLIEITEEEALRRLTTRRICKNCKSAYPAFYDKEACESCDGELVTRKDDTPDAIRTRLDTYAGKTLPVIEDYRANDKMITINGEQDIEDVTKELFNKL